MILNMCIALGQRLTIPWEQNFYVNRNILSLWSFVASLKKISLKSDFIQFFFIILYMYIAGADSPQGTKFWCQQKCLVTSFICSKFQKHIFEVWFYIIFSWFNPSHAHRNLSRMRQYPSWLLVTTFVDSMGYPRYNPQKTRKQWRTRDRQFHWLWGWFPKFKNNFYDVIRLKTRGPSATMLTWIYSYGGYIQPKYCKCCMQEKLTFRLPWQLIKFSILDLIHIVVRGLLKEHYCSFCQKYLKSDRNKGLFSLFPL